MGRRRSILAAVALVLVLAGALAAPATAQDNQAMVRVVHASPDAPAVDVLVDGDVVFSDVSFAEVTPYAPLAAGRHRVQVRPAGNQAQPVIDTTLDVQADTDYTVAAAGRLAEIRPVVLTDDNDLPSAQQARVRAVHLSPDAPAVDVAVAGGPVLFGNLSFGNASGYQAVDAGTVNLQVRAAGTDRVVLDLPNTNLNGGTVYTVFVVGLLQGQPPLQAVPTQDAPVQQGTPTP